MYSNAPFWFVGLLVVLILGFWPSYFSPEAPSATFEQHFHAVAMMGWVLMLIVSPWWLKRYRYGPLEWLWRALTYRTLPRMGLH